MPASGIEDEDEEEDELDVLVGFELELDDGLLLELLLEELEELLELEDELLEELELLLEEELLELELVELLEEVDSLEDELEEVSLVEDGLSLDVSLVVDGSVEILVLVGV